MTEKQIQKLLTAHCNAAVDEMSSYIEKGGDLHTAAATAKRAIRHIISGNLIYNITPPYYGRYGKDNKLG